MYYVYVPWELVRVTRVEARSREKYLKTVIGREFVKDFMKNNRPRGATE